MNSVSCQEGRDHVEPNLRPDLQLPPSTSSPIPLWSLPPPLTSPLLTPAKGHLCTLDLNFSRAR
jgi:hypothetical protein